MKHNRKTKMYNKNNSKRKKNEIIDLLLNYIGNDIFILYTDKKHRERNYASFSQNINYDFYYNFHVIFSVVCE